MLGFASIFASTRECLNARLARLALGRARARRRYSDAGSETWIAPQQPRWRLSRSIQWPCAMTSFAGSGRDWSCHTLRRTRGSVSGSNRKTLTLSDLKVGPHKPAPLWRRRASNRQRIRSTERLLGSLRRRILRCRASSLRRSPVNPRRAAVLLVPSRCCATADCGKLAMSLRRRAAHASARGSISSQGTSGSSVNSQ